MTAFRNKIPLFQQKYIELIFFNWPLSVGSRRTNSGF